MQHSFYLYTEFSLDPLLVIAHIETDMEIFQCWIFVWERIGKNQFLEMQRGIGHHRNRHKGASLCCRVFAYLQNVSA